MPELRDYQKKGVKELREAIRQGFNPIFYGPTGAGKTQIFSNIAKTAQEKDNNTLIIMHKGTILRQTMRALDFWGVDKPASIKSGQPILKSSVQVAMAQTLVNKLDQIKKPDLILIDEAHHVQESNTWGKIIKHFPDVPRIGFSGSIERGDGGGLAPIFDKIVYGPQPLDLMQDGWLVMPKTKSIPYNKIKEFHRTRGDYDKNEQNEEFSKKKFLGNAFEHYHQYLDGNPSIISCVSIKHAQFVTEQYNKASKEHKKNWNFVTIQGGKKYEKQLYDALDGLKSGSVQGCMFVDVIGEGVDVPACMGFQALRRTLSPVNFIQFGGRVLRPIFPEWFNQYTATREQRLAVIADSSKPNAWYFDHVGNIHIHGNLWSDRHFSLDSKPRTKRKKSELEKPVDITVCSACGSAFAGNPKTCIDCGANLIEQADRENGRKLPKEVDGILEDIAPNLDDSERRRLAQIAYDAQKLSNGEKRKAILREVYKKDTDKTTIKALSRVVGYNDSFTDVIWKKLKEGKR